MINFTRPLPLHPNENNFTTNFQLLNHLKPLPLSIIVTRPLATSTLNNIHVYFTKFNVKTTVVVMLGIIEVNN
jgi:hypothetical protein